MLVLRRVHAGSRTAKAAITNERKILGRLRVLGEVLHSGLDLGTSRRLSEVMWLTS